MNRRTSDIGREISERIGLSSFHFQQGPTRELSKNACRTETYIAAQTLRFPGCSLELVCSLFYRFLCPGRCSHSGFGLGGVFGRGLLRNGNLFGLLGFSPRVERGLRPFDETT